MPYCNSRISLYDFLGPVTLFQFGSRTDNPFLAIHKILQQRNYCMSRSTKVPKTQISSQEDLPRIIQTSIKIHPNTSRKSLGSPRQNGTKDLAVARRVPNVGTFQRLWSRLRCSSTDTSVSGRMFFSTCQFSPA